MNVTGAGDPSITMISQFHICKMWLFGYVNYVSGAWWVSLFIFVPTCVFFEKKRRKKPFFNYLRIGERCLIDIAVINHPSIFFEFDVDLNEYFLIFTLIIA